jgi:hypothetical protein
MKAKHISIKDYYVRAKKKNKTRGRPSKEEVYASAVMSYCLEKVIPQMHKAHMEALLYGTGILKVEAHR